MSAITNKSAKHSDILLPFQGSKIQIFRFLKYFIRKTRHCAKLKYCYNKRENIEKQGRIVFPNILRYFGVFRSRTTNT